MAQIPTPPASRQGSEAPDIEPNKPSTVDSSAELLQSLDTLLEKYLHLLDRHQTLQADFGKQLSSGFLSLAHANYTCPPGRRYGVDYYDDRMKATRKVSLQSSSNNEKNDDVAEPNDTSTEISQPSQYKNIFTIESVPGSHSSEETEQVEENKEVDQGRSNENTVEEDKPELKDDSSAKPKEADSSDSPELSETDSTAAKPKVAKRKKFRSSDPITWYGILVPPSLRSAQKSFTEAIESQVPELASVAFEMRAVEKEVERLRSELEQV